MKKRLRLRLLRNLSLRPGKAYNLVLAPAGGTKPTRFYASEEGDGPQLVGI